MEQQLNQIINLLALLLGRSTYNNCVEINNAVGYSRNPDGFYILVSVAGTIVGVDAAGNNVSHNSIIGYHPIKMVSVSTSSTATMSALF